LHRINIKKLFIATVILLVIYVGTMLGATQAYIFGAQSYSDYVYAISAPFFAGFVFVGFLGILKVYKERASPQCLYGFLIVGFCYCGIEVMMKMTGVA